MLTRKGDTFSALDSSRIGEIKNFLRQNLNVPKKMEELYCLYVYLYFLSTSNYFKYPLNVQKYESPDYVLNMQIGLEVVTLSTQKEKHGWALMRKEYPEGSCIEIDGYIPGSNIDVREGIRKPGERLQGSGFTDFGMENAWLDCFYKRLYDKASLFKMDHFSKYQSNQLIVYDDTSYIPDLDFVLPILQNKYKPMNKLHFDHVHIAYAKNNKVNNNYFFIADVFGRCTRYNIPPNFI